MNINSNGHPMNGYNNIPSTSSHSYHDLPPLFNPASSQVQHPHHTIQNRSPHDQWHQHAMQMNAPSQNVPQQFAQSAWPNQMPPQQPLSNNFSMPFLPPHILQEAYANSRPVEAGDEPFLLTQLLSSRRNGESYKELLNSLHGKRGHSASLWKDYYLDHKDRLDSWIAMCLKKEKEIEKSSSSDLERVKASLPTIKKPSPASFKSEPSPHVSSRSSFSALSTKRPQKRSSTSTPPIIKDQPQSSRRSTINSITAPSPVYGGRLPAPHSEIKIPDPPSRSPTPPTRVIPHLARGNRYTKEDREYFINFIGWRLKQDPSLTRLDICKVLAEKAPHHSAQSWASHWSNNHDLPDKILAAARGEDYEDETSEEEKMPSRQRPKYKDITTSEESEGSESNDDANFEDDDDEDEDDDKSIPQYSEKEMGRRGDPFTDADMYITATYIASFVDWENTSAKDRWEPYNEKYPQRSAKAWGEYYRRYEHGLMKLANKIKKRQGNIELHSSTSSIQSQCARPSRAPSDLKRKFGLDSNDGPVKRGKLYADG